MGFTNCATLSFLLILANVQFINSQIILKNTGSLINGLRSVNLTSNNRVWTFHRNNQGFHLTPASYASDVKSKRGRFNFLPNDDSYKIQDVDTLLYFWINELGQLVSGGSSTQASTFVAKLANENNSTLFNLFVDETDPLVTVQSRSPFYFHRQSKYPLEPPVEFTLSPYKVDIEESYGGNRNNIIPTAILIRRFEEPEDFDASYEELLNSMSTRAHWVGKEIFEVGQIIFNDTKDGSNSAFRKLPTLVQSVCSGAPTKLLYFDGATGQNLSLIEDNVPKSNLTLEPFRFTLNANMSGLLWSMTYGTNIQLYGTSDLDSTSSSTKRFEFQLHLHSGFSQISIHTKYSIRFNARDSGSFYSFGTHTFYNRTANFFVIPYTFEDVYGENRTRIVRAANFIQQTQGIDKGAAYERLIRLMEMNGHFEGKEVFHVAQYVKEDLGYNVPIFNLLPLPVQLVSSGVGVSLNYNKSNTLFPFKYSWASDLHTNILPYTFDYSKEQSQFSITYGGIYQLRAVGGDLVDENTPTTDYTFLFDLQKDLINFEIHSCCYQSLSRPFWTSNTQPDFYFKYTVGSRNTFTIAEFVRQKLSS